MPFPSGDKKERENSLHIVALPLRFVFVKGNGIDLRQNKDRTYLISAHVESSESSGLSSLIGHLLSHFSSVADYQEGERIGRDVLKVSPSGSSLIKNQFFSTKKLLEPKTQKSSGRQIPEYLRSIPKYASALTYAILVMAWLLGYFNVQDYFEGLLESTFSQLGLGILDRLVVGIVGLVFILCGLDLVRRGTSDVLEEEKSALFGIVGGIACVILGACILHVSIFFTSSLTTFVISATINILGLIFFYMMTVSSTRFRFVFVALFILALEIVFLQWVPDFLVSIGISNIYQVRIILALGLAFLISFFIGFFHNYMKGVEVIMELERGFMLFVGKRGVSRTVIKQKLGKILGIEEKHSLVERFTGIIRVYLGFRPQGTIDFHIGLPKESNGPISGAEAPETDIALYPVTDPVFDGASLELTAQTSSGCAVMKFEDIMIH